MFKSEHGNLFDELLMDPILPMGSQTKGPECGFWIDVQVAFKNKSQ